MSSGVARTCHKQYVLFNSQTSEHRDCLWFVRKMELRTQNKSLATVIVCSSQQRNKTDPKECVDSEYWYRDDNYMLGMCGVWILMLDLYINSSERLKLYSKFVNEVTIILS